MKPYRILITGSRDWNDVLLVRGAIAGAASYFHGPVVVVHGACQTGADLIASTWAREMEPALNVTEEPHPANWRPDGKFDRSAGFKRNAEMVNLGADVCLAFIRNGSRGASHTARLAEQAGIPTRRWTAP